MAAPPPPPPPRAAASAAEVDRILACAANGYADLGLPRDGADPAAVKAAYRRLSLAVHPDRCPHPRAHDAAAALNRAHDALTTEGVKRRLYDAYIDDLEKGGGGGAAGAGPPASFEEWQANAMQLPRWVQRLMTCPGGACWAPLLLCAAALVALPLLLVAALLSCVVCFPLQTALSVCGVVPPPWRSWRAAREEEGGGEEGVASAV
jgi:hypothetical protein